MSLLGRLQRNRQAADYTLLPSLSFLFVNRALGSLLLIRFVSAFVSFVLWPLLLCSRPGIPPAHTLRSGGPDMAGPWRAVTLQHKIAVHGGYSSKPWVLDTIEVETSIGAKSFCRINKKEQWLLKCCAGPTAQPGGLKRSAVINVLKDKLAKVSCDPVNAAVAEVANDHVANDPMLALDAVGEEDDLESARACKKQKYSPKRMANRVFTIDMPVLPQEAAGSAVAGSRPVRLLCRSTNQVWIAVEDIDWLVKYVATEVALGGVAEIPEAAVAAGNCEVPDLWIRWDFGQERWRADFVAGKLKGKSFTSSIPNMNETKWSTVEAMIGVEHGKANFEQLKEGTRLFLQLHCQMLLADA